MDSKIATQWGQATTYKEPPEHVVTYLSKHLIDSRVVISVLQTSPSKRPYHHSRREAATTLTMTLHHPNPNPNNFIRFMRQIYHPIGFKKGYNFTLFFIFAGAMLGFCLARLEYFSINGIFKKDAAPGEFYYYSQTFYKAGITLHLTTIIPAGILAILQFTPAIRHKALLFHRINGYIIILLLICGITGALMIARHAFGGTLATQLFVGVLAISTITSAFLAYYNIKRLQIDQHRAWMLRCWFYAGSIITLRIIMVLSAMIISRIGGFYQAMPCEQIAYMGGDVAAYPSCNANTAGGQTAVLANFFTKIGVEQVAASMQTSFGMAGVLAFLLHAFGIEMYLRLTPAEGERLRQVSYERQLERGFRCPGSSGLTVDRLGDAEGWKPKVLEQEKIEDDRESSTS